MANANLYLHMTVTNSKAHWLLWSLYIINSCCSLANIPTPSLPTTTFVCLHSSSKCTGKLSKGRPVLYRKRRVSNMKRKLKKDVEPFGQNFVSFKEHAEKRLPNMCTKSMTKDKTQTCHPLYLRQAQWKWQWQETWTKKAIFLEKNFVLSRWLTTVSSTFQDLQFEGSL